MKAPALTLLGLASLAQQGEYKASFRPYTTPAEGSSPLELRA